MTITEYLYFVLFFIFLKCNISIYQQQICWFNHKFVTECLLINTAFVTVITSINGLMGTKNTISISFRQRQTALNLVISSKLRVARFASVL